jgi:hypothetical protein
MTLQSYHGHSLKWNIKNNVSGETKKPINRKHKEFYIPAKVVLECWNKNKGGKNAL